MELSSFLDSIAPCILLVLIGVLIYYALFSRTLYWDKGEPNGRFVLAKLKEDFCHSCSGYEVLYLDLQAETFYDENGDEIPINAIEKFIIIEN